MIYLILSILASTIIFVIFKLISRFGLDTLQVIVVNYFTACSLGIMLSESEFSASNIIKADWFYGAVFLGILFIVIFNIMALTAQRNGISVVSVATKMSIVIPILLGIYLYDEGYGWLKVLGIILALAAVYLASVKSDKILVSLNSLLLPIVLFIGSGIIDGFLKYMQHHHLDDSNFSIFSSSVFFFAGIIGILILIIKYLKNGETFKLKSIPAGITLGIVNFGSIYYLLKALNIDRLESSTVFTINNVAIVLISTIVGLVIFKEKLYTKNWLGIALAVISIVLVSITI